MTQAYLTERLVLTDTLLEKKHSDIIYGRVWTLEPKSLRFKHGETIAELKIPYHLGADDETVVENIVLALASLLKKRFEPSTHRGAAGANQADPLFIEVPQLKDKTYLTDIFTEDSLEKNIATEILSSTPTLDSTILLNWLCPGGHGKAFIKWVDTILEKALKDEAKTGWEEPTSYLTLLAVMNTIKKKKGLLKKVRVRGVSYEKLDFAVSISMFVVLKEAVRNTLKRLKKMEVSYYTPQVDVTLISTIVPKAFLSIPGNLLSGSLNPYSISSEIYEALQPYGGDFSEEAEAIDKLIEETCAKIKNNQNVLEAVRLQYNITRFRTETLKFMTEFDIAGAEAQRLLHELYCEDRVIKNYLTDSRHCEELSAAVEETKKMFSPNSKSAQLITDYQRCLGSFRKTMLSGFLRSGRNEEIYALDLVIRAFYACKFDEHVDRFAGLMRDYLADRRNEFNAKTLKVEYSKGRLYRFSTDDRQILKTLELEEEGQLFIDMKDFTRKTIKVKEIAMADFMKEYFYRPILNAASRYSMGGGIATDERCITLTNLPGDAAIFSGDVTYLVSLARDIQRVIRKYKGNLESRLPPRKGDEIIEEVHKSFEKKRAELQKKRAELNEALNRRESGLEEKLIALGEEEHRLENTYREELEAAIKGELEAGLYISYGTKAETMFIDAMDGLSAPVKVSIGEKINESARGTYRNPMVRTKLEILLESERRRRSNPNLKYPFDIYIDRIYSLRVPHELEAPFEKLVTSRNPSSAGALSKIMSNEFYTDLKKIISGEPFSSLRLVTSTTDIYNKGHALSKEALDAYIKENRGVKFFFRKTVRVDSLDKSIREAFFFPFREIDFWLGTEMVKGAEVVEVFARIGEVIFKGFEGGNPTVIYEILNPEGDFCKALIEKHLKVWSEEARNTPDSEAETF